MADDPKLDWIGLNFGRERKFPFLKRFLVTSRVFVISSLGEVPASAAKVSE